MTEDFLRITIIHYGTLVHNNKAVYVFCYVFHTMNCLVKNKTGCKLDRDGSAVPACGPCRQSHTLTDRTGAKFPLLPAFGHRTEIQNCKPMYLADRNDWKQLGLTYARLRFTTESAEECAAIMRAYREGAPAPGEFTRGLYERGVE